MNPIDRIHRSIAHALSSGRGGQTWHSWELAPWKHPWLTTANLTRAKAFSREYLAREREVLSRKDPRSLRMAFVCNMANSSYTRAKPLRRAGLDVSIYLHPQDDYVMAHPGWEEYDGVLPSCGPSLSRLAEEGVRLPAVDDVHHLGVAEAWEPVYRASGERFLTLRDRWRYRPFLSSIATLVDLQRMDVLWCTQAPYLGYLARRPYVCTQSGGDIWFEASRGDRLGELMRLAYRRSRLFLVSNPWSYAHARRLGLRNLVYLPRTLDEDDYAPGESAYRTQWETESGGRFFVLTTSRLDERNKGSSIGIEGFARFAASHPQARLVFIGWGKDDPVLDAKLEELGIAGRVIRLPISGKGRLREYLRSAHVFIDQFVLGYFGSAGLEAMACGLPTIGRFELAQYAALSETGAPPVWNCGDAGAVAEALSALAADGGRREASARDHRQWFLDNHGGRTWVDDYAAVLTATALQEAPDLTGSPLFDPLTDEERAHHAAGLAAAPSDGSYGW